MKNGVHFMLLPASGAQIASLGSVYMAFIVIPKSVFHAEL